MTLGHVQNKKEKKKEGIFLSFTNSSRTPIVVPPSSSPAKPLPLCLSVRQVLRPHAARQAPSEPSATTRISILSVSDLSSSQAMSSVRGSMLGRRFSRSRYHDIYVSFYGEIEYFDMGFKILIKG